METRAQGPGSARFMRALGLGAADAGLASGPHPHAHTHPPGARDLLVISVFPGPRPPRDEGARSELKALARGHRRWEHGGNPNAEPLRPQPFGSSRGVYRVGGRSGRPVSRRLPFSTTFLLGASEPGTNCAESAPNDLFLFFEHLLCTHPLMCAVLLGTQSSGGSVAFHVSEKTSRLQF